LKKAVIIGSGIGGLASAIRLAAKGYEITVYEKNAYLGGKVTEVKGNGFRFDAGPSVFTLPQLVKELLTLSKEQIDFEYQKLPVVTKYFWEDGTVLNAFANGELFKKEIVEKLGESNESIEKSLAKSELIYNLTKEVFLESSLHKLKTYTTLSAWKALFQIYRINAFKSLHYYNNKRFVNEKTVQLFDRFATYNGSNPFEAPGTLGVIPHLEHSIGAFVPKGGMHSITKTLVKIAKSWNVQFETNTKVESIKVEDKKAKGVIVNGEFKAADVVVSNMDVNFLYPQLLSKEKHPKTILDQPKSSSALIFYWGMNKTFDDLDVHNIFFSKDYKREFNRLFKELTFSDDLTIYLYISSKFNEGDAPKGKENWFVMVNAPHNNGQNWDALIQKVKASILKKLSKQMNCELSEYIEFEEILSPPDIESKTFSHKGSLYGSSSNNMMAAFLRHPNFSRKINNLFYVGGSVHPGGGIPLCLLGAKIVDGLT